MKPLRVLSLFDGISCGRIAFEKAEIPIEVYYASEIDKYAIAVTQKNYPDTIQVGDIRELDGTEFEGKIDILIGGSPCQNFSSLGDRKGLSGEKSSLFYEYVRILEEVKPKYFLLENNANMPKKAKEIISEMLGVEPIRINSKKFVQQNRDRYYWTNLHVIEPIFIQNPYKNILEENREEIELVPFVENKLPLIKEKYGYIPEKFNPYNLAEIKDIFPCLTAQGNSQTKSSTVIIYKDGKYSKLSPIECERLQCLPDNYTDNIPMSKRFKVIGNGWTVDVIKYLFSFLKEVK